MVAASKKEMNDTVIQLRDKDGHNSMVRLSVSLNDKSSYTTDRLNRMHSTWYFAREERLFINHFIYNYIINKSYFFVITKDVQVYSFYFVIDFFAA